jgi:hypothetical protein
VHRHEPGEAEWERIEPLLPVRPGPRSRRGDRDFVNAVIWRVRTGVPLRDLPERSGAWQRLFKELAIEVDETGSLLEEVIAGDRRTARLALEARFTPATQTPRDGPDELGTALETGPAALVSQGGRKSAVSVVAGEGFEPSTFGL